jgi:hypothetical protein
MLSPERTGLLKSFLGSLPEEIALRLARAVEVDRLSDGKSFPHEMILEGLRPALRRLNGSDRTPTPLRFFCLPFEDLFTVVPRHAVKQKGRIARGSVAPIWTWVSRTLLPLETRNYCRNFKSAIAAANHADSKAQAASFWQVAADAMRDALGSEAERGVARRVLNGELVLADAEEAALMLSIGPAVMSIHEALVRPVPLLTDELLKVLRTIHDRLSETTPDAAPYVAVIAMNRLARPWEALKLHDKDLVGEIILGDLEMYANAVRAAKHPDFDEDRLIDNISHFTQLSSGIGVDMRRDGKWGQRLTNDRAALAQMMDNFMQRAPKELAAALLVRNRLPDSDKTERALRYARLVVGCKPFAAAGSFGASVRQAEAEMGNLLRCCNEALVKELRAIHPARRALVEAQLETAVKLSAALFSVEEAEFLRRRGRAARNAARAA